MAWWVGIIVSVALSVVGELIRPKQSVPNAKASALDEFDLPTAEAGRIISLFVGKVRVTGSNVTWYGDLDLVPLTKRVKTGMFSSARQTYAFKYLLGAQHVIGFGEEGVQLHKVFFDELEPKHTTTANADGSVTWQFDDEALFGGNESEGGISGTMRFYPGNDRQEPNAYLAEQLGEDVPAYYNLCYAMLEQLYVGTSKYIKPISFEVSRYPNALGVPDGKHIIGEDANPVCFIYEILTNRIWGVGKPASTIDLEVWRDKAATVHEEGFGFSAVYNGASTAEEMITEVLRHIDGVVFSDPQTGLVTIGLARNDYVKADLPVFGPDDFIEPPKFSRPSWSETRNSILVSFTDRENNYTVTPVPFQDQANIEQRQGEISTESVDFGGFTTRTAMTAAGMRALKAYAWPLASLSGRLDRKAWKTRPNDVVVINWPDLGIDNIVFRITTVGYGQLSQNTIQIDSIEDVFSVGANAYDPPPQSGWVNPARPPQALMRQALIEAPFFMTDSNSAFVAGFATQSGALDEGVDIQTGLSAGALTTTGSSRDFTTSAVLTGAIGRFDGSAAVGGFGDLGELDTSPSTSDVNAGDTVVLLKSATTEEWISYTGINPTLGTLTGAQRGLFDTVPQAHPAGTVAWFVPTGFVQVNPEAIATFPTSFYARLLPFSALGTLAETSGTVMNVTVNQRSVRPYPPGRIRVNGTRPDLLGAAIAAPFTYTWEPRNRTVESLVTQDATGITAEDGTTYTIRVYNASGTLLVQKTGIAGGAKSASIDTTFVGNLRVDIVAVRNGLESYQVRSEIVPIASGGAGNTITADEPSYVLDGGGA